MKALLLGLSALAVVGGTTMASAQDVDVRIKRDHGYHRGWDHHRWHHRGDYTGSVGCKTIIIHREGMTKRIRKCG
jgi:hypothetical protein